MAVTPGGAVFDGRRWLARVRIGPKGAICGAALAIDDEHVLTCAHVVAAAGAQGPGASVFVDFPLLKGAGCWADVLDDGWAPPPERETTGDTALLRLREGVPGLIPVPLRRLRSVDGHTFSCFGFPKGFGEGLSTEGGLGKPVGQEWVKLEISSHVEVEQGFSGAAVWSDQARAVVGMVVTRHGGTAGRVAFAIPLAVIAERSRLVADALPTALDLDPDRETHWGPRSRGVSNDLDKAGWLFSGRRRATGELVEWLRSGRQPALRVVTGAPGSGKSAVVARLVTTSDRHYRRRIPGLTDDDPTVAPPDAFEVTFLATGKTVTDLVEHVAKVTDVEADDVPSLLARFDQREWWPVVAVDALDESAEPGPMAQALVNLGARGGRVLVGTRPDVVGRLSDPDPMRVDGDPYLEGTDIELYVRRLLEVDGAGWVSDAAVRELCEAAGGNFLIAQLGAHALPLTRHRVGPSPRQVHQAFDQYLHALPDSKAARDLLLPLAYVFGDGLPAGPADDLWLTAVAALSRPYAPADLHALLKSPAGSFLITHVEAAGGARHRFFHAALGETLTFGRDRQADQRAIWRAWVAKLAADPAGRIAWFKAPRYLRQHGSDHAAAAGLLPELVDDPGHLLVGDLDRLLVHLAEEPDERVLPTRAVLRHASHRAGPLDPSLRAQVLALAARHLGFAGFASAVVAQGQPRWAPRWAHTLGHAHQPLVGHSDSVRSVAFGSLAGRAVVVSGDEDGKIRWWDATSGQQLGEPLAAHDGPVCTVACGRVDGSEVVVSGGIDGFIRMWGANRERLEPAVGGRAGAVSSVALGEVDGRAVVVSGGDDGSVRLWNVTGGGPCGAPLLGHGGAVSSVALGEVDGRAVVISGGDDGSVRLWEVDVTGGRARGAPLLGHGRPVRSVAFGEVQDAGDGPRGPRRRRAVVVSGGDDGTVRLWDVTGGEKLVAPLAGHGKPVRSVTLGDVDGKAVIVSGGEDETVRMWDAARAEPLGAPLRGHAGPVFSVALGEVGRRAQVASAGDDKTVRLWDTTRRQPGGSPTSGHRGVVLSIACGRIGGTNVVVSGGGDRTVRVWDAATGKSCGEPWGGHGGQVRAVAVGEVAGHAVVVAGGADGKLRRWDPASRRSLEPPLTGHAGGVYAVALGQVDGGDVVVSAGADGTVRRWDATGGRPLGRALEGHTAPVVAVACGQVDEDDVIVSGAADGTLRRWDASRGCSLGEPLTGHTGSVPAVALGRLAERELIASGGEDGTVRLWDALRGHALGTPLTGHFGPVRSVAFGRLDEGEVVVSGGDDGTVRLWRVADSEECEVIFVEAIQLLEGVRAVGIDGDHGVFVASGHAVCALQPTGTKLG
jgi:WD40 repeat protein